MKDAAVTLDGRTGILSSHLNFGDPRRGWDFRSLGHGDVDFESIIRELNRIAYTGPLSVEWEDSGMDREHGAEEACAFVRQIDFPPSELAFDAAFD
jgi:sugar phosphate isomerase/epimerase